MSRPGPSGSTRESGSDLRVEGFAIVERDAVRRSVPGFDWLAFAEPSPANPIGTELSDARIALITTSGARTRDQERFDTISDAGDPSFRVIAADTDVDEIAFDHGGYDKRHAYDDPDCVFPLRLLRRYVEEGRIGGLASSAFSVMGYITQTDVLMEQSAPAIAEALKNDEVDLALLVPA